MVDFLISEIGGPFVRTRIRRNILYWRLYWETPAYGNPIYGKEMSQSDDDGTAPRRLTDPMSRLLHGTDEMFRSGSRVECFLFMGAGGRFTRP